MVTPPGKVKKAPPSAVNWHVVAFLNCVIKQNSGLICTSIVPSIATWLQEVVPGCQSESLGVRGLDWSATERLHRVVTREQSPNGSTDRHYRDWGRQADLIVCIDWFEICHGCRRGNQLEDHVILFEVFFSIVESFFVGFIWPDKLKCTTSLPSLLKSLGLTAAHTSQKHVVLYCVGVV